MIRIADTAARQQHPSSKTTLGGKTNEHNRIKNRRKQAQDRHDTRGACCKARRFGSGCFQVGNDITCPDVMTLPKLAELLGITVDELAERKKQPQTLVLADEERKSVDDMMLKIIVNSHEGDKVKVNLPIPLVKAGLRIGMGMPQVKGNAALESIDFGELIALIDSGVIGKLVEVESADGDIVEITVE